MQLETEKVPRNYQARNTRKSFYRSLIDGLKPGQKIRVKAGKISLHALKCGLRMASRREPVKAISILSDVDAVIVSLKPCKPTTI